ncbi:MAG: hypothetical protein Q9167_008104 [Letrouitia subvulpina]
MDRTISSSIEKMREPKPKIHFQDLWLLFKPGIDIYWVTMLAGNFDYMAAGVVIDASYRDSTEANYKGPGETKQKTLNIQIWYLESNGKVVGRNFGVIYINRFEGEREVTSLRIFPCNLLDRLDGGKTRRTLLERGRKTFQIFRGMPKQMYYDGYVFNDASNTFRGNCMVDTRTFKLHMNPEDYRKVECPLLLHELCFQGSYSDMADRTLSDFPFRSFRHIDIATTPSLPSERHYFLLAGAIGGFVLFDKSWEIFLTESLVEVWPTKAMNSLHIDPDNLDIIRSITHAQIEFLSLDQTYSKGEGHVVLLHGSPGVGKTYTVECIAEATGRPLISLSMGDVIPNDIDNVLKYFFGLAEQWKAILLLDVADIFLEQRASRDIQRNSIVSIFLRRMEFFRGIVFLTTNRVGQIDDAFISRVSAVLQYNHLTDDTRKKIWQGFFKKLEHESAIPGAKKVIVDKYAQKFVQNDHEVRELQWNGREIRNTLQTAISLASYKALEAGQSPDDPVEVEEDHFRKAVSMSRKFRVYMKSITGLGEDARAKARSERPHPDRMLNL